jgi:hypothetical protein
MRVLMTFGLVLTAMLSGTGSYLRHVLPNHLSGVFFRYGEGFALE